MSAETGSPVRAHGPTGRVLLVDDSELLLEFLSGELAEYGWQVQATNTGETGIALSQSWSPDVVVCDLHMPEMNGFELVGRLTAADPTLPVVVLTGDDDRSAVLQAVHAGAFDYVIKAGDDVRPLVAALERAVDHRRVVRENARLADALCEANEELEKRIVELAETNRALVDASTQKNQFLATMSHELRTPLNAIMGFARIVLRKTQGQIDTQQTKNLEMIQSSAQQLLGLVNEMLDFQRIESGALNLSISEVDVDIIVEHVVASLSPAAAAKGLTIETELEVKPLIVRTDGDRLRQILINFVNNAVKYSERGCIRVRTRIDRGQVRIEVHDQGIGIPDDALPHVFTPFYQVDGSSTRERDGVGLGLAIVQKLSRLLGGDVAVESEVGKGSTFTLVLPASMRVERSPALEPIGSGPIILVIVDQDASKQVFREQLAKAGYRVHVASSGEEGIAKAQQLKPDGIVLDLSNIPGGAGLDLLRELRNDPGTCEIPVVVSNVRGKDAKAYELPVAGFLSKPFEATEFRSVMQRLLTDPRKDVLVVDDDGPTRVLVEQNLAVLNVRVRTAATGRDALIAIEDRMPQAVILDLKLPDVDGSHVLRQLRQHPGGKDVAVVVYTAKDLAWSDRHALHSELVEVIRKTGDEGLSGLVEAVRKATEAEETSAARSGG